MIPKKNRRHLGVRLAAAVVLSSLGVVGLSTPASAAPTHAYASVATAQNEVPLRSSDALAEQQPSSPAPSVTPKQERGLPIKQAVDAAVKIIKSIPGWWSKFSKGLKQSYSWFVKYVWNPLVAVANAIQICVTGWDIWHYFN